jgi:hypothetical protein
MIVFLERDGNGSDYLRPTSVRVKVWPDIIVWVSVVGVGAGG